jgi:hypothetical protein
VILVGIDDTDTPTSEGTNQLARALAGRMPPGFRVQAILRHQLLFDRRIPYTSHNGSASLLVDGEPGLPWAPLVEALEAGMRAGYREGSDPGLCIARAAPAALRAWGRRCQREIVRAADARRLAAAHDVYLRDFGGTGGGVIGALAAVGLAAGGEDGRVVHLDGWPWPDGLRDVVPLESVQARGVQDIRELASGRARAPATLDIGTHLRPSWRGGRPVLFVQRDTARRELWRAVKLP